MADWIIDVVSRLGYLGIALLTLLENVFPPIPSELIMPLAGYQASQDQMNLWGAVAAGSLGSLTGTCAWYYAGLRIGERRLCRWIERHGRWLAIDIEDVDKAQEWFRRHGVWAIFVCRLTPGLRTLISLPAGFNRMPLSAFLWPSALGTLLWTAALSWAGFALGENFQSAGQWVGVVSWVVIGFIAAAYVWRQIRYWRAGRSRQPEPEPE
jgi:membrane protein DedA with SNARE-associated domain